MNNKIFTFIKKYPIYLCLILFIFAVFVVVIIPTFSVTTTSSVWDGTIASSFASGNGSKESPYEINTGSELAYFKSVSTASDYFNKYYKLTNNIDLNSLDFSNTNYGTFSGNFDGGGYSIYNFKIENFSTDNTYDYYGLFSNVTNASISNINIYNININISNNTTTSYVGLLASNLTSTTIKDVSIYKLKINITNSTVYGGGLIANDISGNSLININADVSSNNTSISSLIYNYSSASLTNILVCNNGLNIFSNNSSSDIYTYTIASNNITFTNNYDTDAVLSILNSNSDYKWKYSDASINLSTSQNDTSNDIIIEHDTGISNNVVYVNDLSSDENYYKGLNYTTSTDGTLPTEVDKNIYNDTNLVKVQMTYLGSDPSGTYKGTVSLTESQDEYVYYKYYTIDTNGTSNTSDDFVKIELIDNPFANMPNNMGFNGWVTTYKDAKVSYEKDYFSRYVTIPLTYTNGVPNPINITLNAKWTVAKTYELTSSNWGSAFSGLDEYGFHELTDITSYNYDMTGYYVKHTASRDSYYSGYNYRGRYISTYCYSRYGCTYYTKIYGENYDPSKTYYELSGGQISAVNSKNLPLVPTTTPNVMKSGNMGGFYTKAIIPYGGSIVGYYSSDTNIITSGTCDSYGGCEYYKLLQYYDSSGNEETYDSNKTYYYLADRDTNIVILESAISSTWSSAESKPFTLTSLYNGVDYRSSSYIDLRSKYINCYNDTTIQYVELYSTQSSIDSDEGPTGYNDEDNYIYGNWKNLKIGRGITHYNNYVSAYGFIGGNNSSSGSENDILKYRLIVESGYYLVGSLTTGQSSGINVYTEAKAIYGSDYDRASGNNDNLNIYICIAGSWGGNIHASSKTNNYVNATYKSGSFGSGEYSNVSGIYVGSRTYGTTYAIRKAIIEGGWFYVINSGPITSSDLAKSNDTLLYVKGGEIYYIFGGAGKSPTYGNRIVQVTGGLVDYSVFGGSNANKGDNTDGKLNGSTYVYIGGNATIGKDEHLNDTTLNWDVEAGSVFGNGNGRTGYSSIGSVENSVVVIDGEANIKRNVYGGGNYGATGVASNYSTTYTHIHVIGGTIDGSVYGGGNNNGSGSSSKTSTITINMLAGLVKGSIYGGSRTTGTIYGSTDVQVLSGNISTDVYGRGQGNSTYVGSNTNVTIGSTSSSPNISGDVYGGSEFGTVNSTTTTSTANSNTTNVTLVDGKITGSIYGGAKGSSSYAPSVNGNITVNINGGTASSVYGGFNLNGNLRGSSVVNLNKGTIGDVYGGSRQANMPTSNVNLQGSTISGSIYGGSNLSGTATTTNVILKSGNVAGSVYGGNNQGGTTTTSNVTYNGGTITGSIYGGGNVANTDTTNVNISDTADTTILATTIYGGGNAANATTTNVNLLGRYLNYVYGGSNTSGTVTNSIIKVNKGEISNIYGGNNQGGTTLTSTIYTYDGKITNLYGGGNLATSGTTNLNIEGSTITNMFGGGNKAEVTTSNLNITNGKITNAYGAGNEAGATTTNINASKGTITNLYGGANQSGSVTNSYINTNPTITSSSGLSSSVTAETSSAQYISSIYKYIVKLTMTITNSSSSSVSAWDAYVYVPDSKLYSNYSTSVVNASSGYYAIDETNPYYKTNTIGAHSSYTFTFSIFTNVDISKSSIENGMTTTGGLFIDSAFGGNNQGGLTSTSHLNINSGVISNLYGGGNKASVDNTNIDIKNGTIGTVYGGGNEASITDSTNVNMTGGYIIANFFGGGNAGEVMGNTNNYVMAGLVKGSLYAGGNGATATVYGNTNIYVGGSSTIGYTGGSIPTTGSVFGGGNAASTGVNTANNSKATVMVTGGTIHGNVYGGANTAAVYGTTEVKVGSDITLSDSVIKGDINITGTVFGGGEANASGSTNYDYSFISVTKGIVVNINGLDYTINIGGSVFGSGDASSTSGTSVINISNLGTYESPKDLISIQRTNTLTINSSSLHLSGATDRTNEYSDKLFTLSIIDELDLKNGSTLYLENGANLLKTFKSVDSNNNLETVNIDSNNKTVTTSTTNRLYMLGDNNLNVATNESVTSYGNVYGMTFLGIYTKTNDGTIKRGIYDTNKGYGDTLSWGDVPSSGTYVLGLHAANHDINVNGFYSNYISTDDPNNAYNIPAVVKPQPDDSDYYMWIIGDVVTKYEIDLVASKYSTLGTVQLAMRDFAKANTTFHVVGLNTDNLNSDITLTTEDNIPRTASTTDIADHKMALVMENTKTGWLNDGTTTYVTGTTHNVVGTTQYIGENTNNVPNLLFYLYHSKNLGSTDTMGSVEITLLAVTKIDDLNSVTKRIKIKVNMSRVIYNTNDYEGAITSGRNYSMFGSTDTNITNRSSISAYFSLYDSTGNIYRDGYHRALVSSYVLPLKTKITMIDLSSSTPKYYYHIIDADDVSSATTEINSTGDSCSYDLSKFETMGSDDATQKYNDASMNSTYYHDSASSEEFIFILDFEDTSISENIIDQTLLMELRSNNNAIVKSVLGIEHSDMTYSIYTGKDSIINANAKSNKSTIYAGETAQLQLNTIYNETKVTGSSNIIQDTTYFESKMGIKISILNSQGNIVTGTSLLGLYYEINGKKYNPNLDGTTRIKIADKVGNSLTYINLVTQNANIATGSYKIHIETYGSPDGIYYGLTSSGSVDIPFTFVNSNYGLNLTTDDNSLVTYHDTGYNLNGNNQIKFDIDYSSILDNPKIDIKLLRRKYDNTYDTDYEEVDIKDYISNDLIGTSIPKEYLIIGTPAATSSITLKMKSNLQTGTYKIQFILKDSDTTIDTIEKYIIIK